MNRFMTNIIHINDFADYIGDNQDMGSAIFHAVQQCAKQPNTVLSFPQNTYHVHPDRCDEQYLFISNHDHSLKRIAFALENLSDVTIDGNGSQFMFHGRVMPFMLRNCKNVTIRNLSIDYERPFFTQGVVLDASLEHVTLNIDPEEYPFYVEDGIIHFYSPDEWDNTYIKWFVEFDPKRRAPAYGFGDSNLRTQQVKAELLSRDTVKFSAQFRQIHTVGNVINITHEQRYNPGLFIDESENVVLENIQIFHAGAMGVIAQNSRNISLNQVDVTVREGSSRVVSTNNDATHFVNCEGLIKLENCTFQHQLDDGTNVHGMYNEVSRVYSERLIEVQIMHFQQVGVCIYRKGDRVAIVDKDTQLPKGHATVTNVEQRNQHFIELSVEAEPGTQIHMGDIVENVDRMPEVEIRHCRIGDNRARGLLIATNRRALVEDNHFYTSGSSISSGTETFHWYESGAIRDLTIRRNKFINCGYGKWGDGVIRIQPKFQNPQEQECLVHNIKVTENEFYTFKPTILNLFCSQGVEFSRNQIRRSTDFQPFGPLKHCMELAACEQVVIKDNHFEGFEESELIQADSRSSKSLITTNNQFAKKGDGEN
ncbi:MAG: Alpha-galactosidase, family [Paenibacillaceae bacterium]|nr:Alpha-galactosidase, family [Paenibacillaceae bacterium]